MLKGLFRCDLFKDMPAGEVQQAMSGYCYTSATYAKGEVIALKGSRYTALMIVADGAVSAEATDRQDNRIKADKIISPAIIEPASLFADNNRLTVNITARSAAAVIVSIEKQELCELMAGNITIMTNFLEIVSSPARYISDNIVYLTYKTIKGKLANYLLDMAEKTGGTSFRNSLTQREMAEMFGVTRPALARAMGELAQEGTIYVKGKQIDILFTEKLRQYAKY